MFPRKLKLLRVIENADRWRDGRTVITIGHPPCGWAQTTVFHMYDYPSISHDCKLRLSWYFTLFHTVIIFIYYLICTIYTCNLFIIWYFTYKTCNAIIILVFSMFGMYNT